MSCLQLVPSCLDGLVHEPGGCRLSRDSSWWTAAGQGFHSPPSCNFFHKTCWNTEAFTRSLCNSHFLRKQHGREKVFFHYSMQFEQDIDPPFRHVLVSRKHRLPRSFFVKAEAKHPFECITKTTVFRRTNLTTGQILF